MKNDNICDYEGCCKPARPDRFVYGRAYCEDHYLAGLEKAFLEELHSIAPGEASRKFLNVFGRYVEGLYTAKNLPMPEGLAANKLRDRAEKIRHKGNVISFSIERHLGPIPTRQEWHFGLETKEIILINEDPLYLGCEEEGKELGVTPVTVRRYIRDGRLRAKRASEAIEIQNWIHDKYALGSRVGSRGHEGIYSRAIFIIPPRKWLIPQEEVSRLLRKH